MCEVLSDSDCDLESVEFNYHVDKMLSYIRKLKMRKRMYSSRMGSSEMSMYSDQLKSRVDGIREMITEENYTPGNTNNEKLLRGSQQEWQQVPPLENSHLPMSVSVSTNQQPKQPTGYSNVSVVSNSTLFNKSALNQISQKGKQFNGSQMSYMPLEPEQESATESYMVSVSHQLGSDVSYEDESEDQNVVKEPTPPPITTSKTKGRRSTESKKPATSKKDTPKREARIILTPVSAKGGLFDLFSILQRKQPASKLKNLQEDEVDVDTNLNQKNPGKPANKNASKGSEKKAPSRKKKATTNNKKDNAETAVSPGALLNSVKKTTNGLSGRVTPPTGMLVEYMGSKHLNASINMARTNVSKPVNRKQLVKRVTKERKERNQVLESRTSNYGGETSKQIDRILAAATSRTVTTPTILKEVFRKNEKRHDSSGSNLSDDSSAESE
ncbi:hypothetical protein AAG570_010578 [Ranatra chinensis]|uniref:Uncharacterized protein n=1 Tax=Ranatra chinensis TaxID=642074 RepID=A0ABD0YN05_9HEMI